MRVAKGAGSDTQAFYYDGQMPIEDAAVVGSATTITRNGLGARGIDFISTTTSSSTTVAYPIYDGHGNMVATLAKNGTGYNLSNRRSFGAWGEIRQGATSGAPKGRYCANLGHIDDDESGLTYMRARYYEPGSGRFLVEDGMSQGRNWFVYCTNNPALYTDSSGKMIDPMIGMIDGVELEVEAGIAARAMGNGMINMLVRAVANYTLRQVASLASAGAAATQQFVTRVGNFQIEYKLGGDVDMGAFAILTKIKDATGSTVFFGITSGNNAGIYNLHIKFMDMQYWQQQFGNL